MTNKQEEAKVVNVTKELFNKKEKVNVDGLEFEVWRMNVETLELATATVLKISMFFQPGSSLFNLIDKEDVAVVRAIIASCSTLDAETLKQLPMTTFLKIVDKWLEVNEQELIQAAKLFLALRERMTTLNKKIGKK
ncbi:MAG: hypothetical protein DRN81_02575 [Thermoproteota archaeon]|nr:MAG: hypothetical protein DRN81_02575 [Candidatus Korarchaeota archaeon]